MKNKNKTECKAGNNGHVRACVNETPIRDVYWAAIRFSFAA